MSKNDLGASFDAVLQLVSFMADKIDDREISDSEIPEMSLLLGKDEFIRLKKIYEASLPEICRQLQEIYKTLLNDVNESQSLLNARKITHSLKGSAHSFGYQLISEIAGMANERLVQAKNPTKDDIRIFGHQVAAISLIADKKISNAKSEAGALLLKGLRDHS